MGSSFFLFFFSFLFSLSSPFWICSSLHYFLDPDMLVTSPSLPHLLIHIPHNDLSQRQRYSFMHNPAGDIDEDWGIGVTGVDAHKVRGFAFCSIML